MMMMKRIAILIFVIVVLVLSMTATTIENGQSNQLDKKKPTSNDSDWAVLGICLQRHDQRYGGKCFTSPVTIGFFVNCYGANFEATYYSFTIFYNNISKKYRVQIVEGTAQWSSRKHKLDIDNYYLEPNLELMHTQKMCEESNESIWYKPWTWFSGPRFGGYNFALFMEKYDAKGRYVRGHIKLYVFEMNPNTVNRCSFDNMK